MSMFKIIQRFVLLSLAIVLVQVATTQAATTRFDNESLFLTTVGVAQMESFENALLRDHSYVPIDLDDITATGFVGIRNDFEFGARPTDGTQYLSVGGDDYLVTFTFDKPITSFGISIIDFGEGNSSGSLYLGTDAGDQFTVKTVPPNLPESSDFFFGLTNPDESFTQVTLWKTTINEGCVYDELYFSSVPIPGAIWLLGSGLIGLAGLRRKLHKGSNRGTLVKG